MIKQLSKHLTYREVIMRKSHSLKSNLSVPSSRVIAAVLLVLGSTSLPLPGWAQERVAKSSEGSFPTPDLAAEALVASVRSSSGDAILKVLGPEAKRIVSSGDQIADKAARERFLSAYDQGHQTAQEGEGRAILVIGQEQFPFPIPIVKEGAVWRFDAKAGEEEILNRRIGANELKAIEAARAYVDAQREYASQDRDGKGIQYAQRLLSTDGKKDGLYWPVTDGEAESPLGPLIAGARAEGYAARSGSPAPYHGYVFRILKGQGKDAAGGVIDYVVHGRMIGGFGLIAAPAQYGNSGVMTFVVNHDGVVFQKDLGPETAKAAARIETFNPDSTWSEVKGE
jgi:hypothetical protein